MKYTLNAVRKMMQAHIDEAILCGRYRNVCASSQDKQGVKDFARLVQEHTDAAARYSHMLTYDYKCNLNVAL